MKPTALLAALAVSLVLASPAAAQSQIDVAPHQPYVQQATGFTFPAQVNDFERTRLTRFRPDGTDEAAGYVRIVRGQEVVITVYVYPSPDAAGGGSSFGDARGRACATQFGQVRQEIEGVHQDADLIENYTPRTVQNGITYEGLGAAYHIRTRFMGRDNTLLRSEARLFCFVGGQWSVKYRISHPADYNAAPDIDAFMAAMPWTIVEPTL